ncbi:MAG: ankyrin repeat domain-containing protein [Burkholderiaceae bacterium]|jgi:ankyrin repeat protein|nr:ankyrin repeat domain-containing protein [Burkholderiaceae bacterium]
MKWSLTFTGALLAAALAFGPGAQAQTRGQLVGAIKQDDASAIKALLAKGLNPNIKDEHGQPGLVMALLEGSLRAAKALADSPRLKVDETDANGQNALMMAAWAGQMDIAKELVDKGAAVNKPGWTPLHYAASKGQVDMIRYLLGLGADIDAGSPNGSTPLMIAAGYGSPESVKLLIESGADISKRNQLGLSALDIAKRYQRPDAIRLLTQALRFKAEGRVWTRPAAQSSAPASAAPEPIASEPAAPEDQD